MTANRTVSFQIGDMLFEYDQAKNETNIRKHGISFKVAARIFFDEDRIEYFDDTHSMDEDRYRTIGDTSAGKVSSIGGISKIFNSSEDILFVIYTERLITNKNGIKKDVTRIISARLATNFERGLYYGKYE